MRLGKLGQERLEHSQEFLRALDLRHVSAAGDDLQAARRYAARGCAGMDD